ncbi:hypothetical protein KW430_19615 [Vibrio fluvialis]|nr:hypothetical protein [Vibrio fluvialis]
MSHLSDMEELLQKISDNSMSDYMKEALQCYSAGAYRGCIVLSSIALFDDCVRKLAEIRHLNKVARRIHDEVTKRQNSQDVYENYLLEQLAANKLISELDSSTAEVIKNRRNKSAHASGHAPSAEEARFIYFEVIDKFLSKKAFSSKVLADEILVRLENRNFFYSSDIRDVKVTVEHETSLLHNDGFPYLLAKLIDNISGADKQLSQNSRYFIDGISCINNEQWNKLLVSQLLEKKLDDTDYSSQCLATVSISPKLISRLSATAKERLVKCINKNTRETPNSSSVNSPAQLFENILRKAPELVENLHDECFVFVSKHSYLEFTPKLAHESGDLWEKYQELLLQRAGSSTFDTANTFSRSFNVVEEQVIKNSTDVYALKLSIAIKQAADWGAWAAESIISNKFDAFPVLQTRVKQYLEQSPTEATKILQDAFDSKVTASNFLSRYIVE